MKIIKELPQINLDRHNIWQYMKAEKMSSLLQKKKEFYQRAHTDFWIHYLNKFFNLATADEWGVTLWGQIAGVSRKIADRNGVEHILPLELYRLLVKGQFYKYLCDGTVPSINKWLSIVFSEYGKVICGDNLDMTFLPFIFYFEPDDNILWLLQNFDFIPRPAGVGYKTQIHEGWTTLAGEQMYSTPDNKKMYFITSINTD